MSTDSQDSATACAVQVAGMETIEGVPTVQLAVTGTRRLRVGLADGTTLLLEVEGGIARLPLPEPPAYARVSCLEAVPAEGEGPALRSWTAEDFTGRAGRWLFAPLAATAQDIATDVRRYDTRISDRRLLLDYALAVGEGQRVATAPDGIAISQVTAVICYRLCDRADWATPERLQLVQDLLEIYRRLEKEGMGDERALVHPSLSLRFACAQLFLCQGDIPACMTALEEMLAFGPKLASSTVAAATGNYINACLLLGSLLMASGEWARARVAFEHSVEPAFTVSARLTRSFSAAREVSGWIMSCATCLAGRDEAVLRLKGRQQGTRYYDLAAAIRSTFRFKNDRAKDHAVARALQALAAPA